MIDTTWYDTSKCCRVHACMHDITGPGTRNGAAYAILGSIIPNEFRGRREVKDVGALDQSCAAST